jgi:hypothetical protein
MDVLGVMPETPPHGRCGQPCEVEKRCGVIGDGHDARVHSPAHRLPNKSSGDKRSGSHTPCEQTNKQTNKNIANKQTIISKNDHVLAHAHRSE